MRRGQARSDSAVVIGTSIGVMIGTGMIGFLWALGAAILGLLVRATRGAKITVEDME